MNKNTMILLLLAAGGAAFLLTKKDDQDGYVEMGPGGYPPDPNDPFAQDPSSTLNAPPPGPTLSKQAAKGFLGGINARRINDLRDNLR